MKNGKSKVTEEPIRCKYCNCSHCPVINVEHREFKCGGKTIIKTRRRRVCRHCNTPFYTVEQYEQEDTIGVPENEPENTTETHKNPYV